MSRTGEHLRALTAEMEQSAHAGGLASLQSQLARWEASVPDENVTREEHLGIRLSTAEIEGQAEMRDRTDKSPAVYELLTHLLIQAAVANQVATVKYITEKRGAPITPMVFLDNGWDINDPAQRYGCPVLARGRWCLEHGADPNARNNNGSKDVPSEAGCYASVPTLRVLAAHGANFACSNALERAAESSIKGRVECMQWLLDEAGFPINQYKFGWDPALFNNWRGSLQGTALHSAVFGNSPNHVRFLLERGSDANLEDTHGRTARDVVHGGRKDEILAILDGWGK
ncbi:ankyrin [Aspergillus californicus]